MFPPCSARFSRTHFRLTLDLAASPEAASCTASSAASTPTKQVWVPPRTRVQAQASRTPSSKASCNRSPYSSTRSSSAPPQPSCASRPTSSPARTSRESFTYKSLSPPFSAATAPSSSHSPCASLATPRSSETTTTPKVASVSS